MDNRSSRYTVDHAPRSPADLHDIDMTMPRVNDPPGGATTKHTWEKMMKAATQGKEFGESRLIHPRFTKHFNN